MCNSGKSCRFLATRGCNPKVKNLEGDTPKVIAKDRKAKDASKNIRKGEKQYNKLSKQTTDSGGINWSIRLYDYMYEHTERVKNLFAINDQDQIGKITRESFVQVISDEGFQALVESSDEMEKLIKSHEKAKDQIDYELFLTGKKYINKQFLISSFEKKKKKKKKKGKGKKGKTKIIMPICILDEGPRMVNKLCFLIFATYTFIRIRIICLCNIYIKLFLISSILIGKTEDRLIEKILIEKIGLHLFYKLIKYCLALNEFNCY